MKIEHKKALHWVDFVVLSLIFFGYFTYNSILLWSYRTEETPSVDASSFSDAENWWGIATELVFLCIATIYLLLRRFDFKLLNFSVGKKSLLALVILVIFGGLASDIIIYGDLWMSTGQNPFNYVAPNQPPSDFSYITWGLLAFALVNGFYEELFFMGLTFAVKSQYRIYTIVASIFVRFIFHIYQGLVPAIGIALLGVVFILVRTKVKSLVPFTLAHALFDVFGAGILYWILFPFK